MDSITLIANIRQTLISLQSSAAVRAKSEASLASGQRIRQAADGALQYFQAKALTGRITDLTGVRDSVNQAVGSVKAALDGAGAIDSVLRQMKGIAVDARASTSETERADLAARYNELREQVDALANDASYGGINLLSSGSSSLRVEFGRDGSVLEVDPRDASSASLGVTAAAVDGTGFTSTNQNVGNTFIDTAIREIDSALSSLATTQSRLGSTVSILSVRDSYSTDSVNTLREAAGKLTDNDPFEDAAALLSSRVRSQLGLASMAIANQSGRSLLSLF